MKLFGVVLLCLLAVGSVHAYDNTCDGRLQTLQDSCGILMANQKLIDYNTSVSFGDTWTISGGARTGEGILQNTSSICEVSPQCLNFTYNITGTTFRLIERQSTVAINGTNFSGIGFWYRGDNSTNYIGQIKLWTNLTPGTVKHNSLVFNPLYLNFTGWKYAYVDFSLIKNASSGTGGAFLNATRLGSINGMSIAIFNGTPNPPISSIYFDNYTLVDFDKGSMDIQRWKTLDNTERDARQNEGVYTLAYMYTSGGGIVQGNSSILNATVDVMDWYIRNQLWDGGWSEVLTDQFGNWESTPASTGFPGTALCSAAILLKDNQRMQEIISIYRIDNFSTSTRSFFINDTCMRAANFGLSNKTLNRSKYTEFTNQEMAVYNLEWLYYNLSGNTSYLNDFNDKMLLINRTRRNANLSIFHEQNTTSNIGFDAGYQPVQDFLFAIGYKLSGNPLIVDFLRAKDDMYQHVVDSTQSRIVLVNSSRGNDVTSNQQRYSHLVSNVSMEHNLTRITQLYYSFNNGWDDYGDFSKLELAENQFRTSFISVFDYQYCTVLSNPGYRWPLNYTYKYYDLVLSNLSLSTRVLNSTLNSTTPRNGLQFPRIIFSHDNENVVWLRGDYLRTNETGWIYSDENGNFTLPITPRVIFNGTSGHVLITTLNGTPLLNTTQDANNVTLTSQSANVKAIRSNFSSAVNMTLYIPTGGITPSSPRITFANGSSQNPTYSYDSVAGTVMFSGVEIPPGTSTIELDTTPPSIVIIGPANTSSELSGTLNFTYTPTDDNLLSCSLYIENQLWRTHNSTNGTLSNFTVAMVDGSPGGAPIRWYVSCTDTASNTANSSTYLLTTIQTGITAPAAGGGAAPLQPAIVDTTPLAIIPEEAQTLNTFFRSDMMKFMLLAIFVIALIWAFGGMKK